MISVIVPIYNVEDYLPRCLESIVSQTYKDLEIILVDDGSTDSSGIICDDYAHNDSRIQVIHKENGGLSSARNFGLRVASGEYVLMPDGDDALHPRMIESLYNLITSGDYDFAMCYAAVVNSVPEKIDTAIDYSNITIINQEDCMGGLFQVSHKIRHFVVVWNKLYRYNMIADINFINTSSEDTCFNTMAFLRTNKAIVLHQNLYYYFMRPSSITHWGVSKWYVGLINSFKLCLDAIPFEKQLYRSYCLRFLYKRSLSIYYWSRNTIYHECVAENIESMKKVTIREYIHNRYIPIYEKVAFIVFIYCPFLYRIFMAIMEYRAKIRNH